MNFVSYGLSSIQILQRPYFLNGYLFVDPSLGNIVYTNTFTGSTFDATSGSFVYPSSSYGGLFFPWGYAIQNTYLSADLGFFKGNTTLTFVPSGLSEQYYPVLKIIYDFNDTNITVIDKKIVQNDFVNIVSLDPSSPKDNPVSHTYRIYTSGVNTYFPSVTVFNGNLALNKFDFKLRLYPDTIFDLEDFHLVNSTQLDLVDNKFKSLELLQVETLSTSYLTHFCLISSLPDAELNKIVITPTPTVTPSITPTITPTTSITPSITPTASITPSITPTISITPTETPAVTVTPTNTPTLTPTETVTPTVTPTSLTPTPTPTITPTETVTPTETPTETVTPTVTPTETTTPTVTPTLSETPTPTPTSTEMFITPTMSPTKTPRPTVTPTKTSTPTATITPTVTPTMTPTITPTETLTPTITPTETVTPTVTETPTVTPSNPIRTIYFYNDGFEYTNLGSGPGELYVKNPVDSGLNTYWVFRGDSGIVANGSILGMTGATNYNFVTGSIIPVPPHTSDLGQAAFLSGGDGEITNISSSYITYSGASLDTSLNVKIKFDSQTSIGNSTIISVSAYSSTTSLFYNLGDFIPTTTLSWASHISPSYVTIPAGPITVYFVASASNNNNITFIDNITVQKIQ